MRPRIWKKKHKIYVNDTDCTGLVYHANYLKFLEQARSDIFNLICEKMKINADEFFKSYGFFVVRKVNIHYLKAMRLFDEAVIESSFRLSSGVRMQWSQKMVCSKKAETYVQADIEIICVNGKMRPQKIPESFVEMETEEYG